MSKSALGRGLAELQQQPQASRGVHTIVSGAREARPVVDDFWPLIRATLVAADAALLALSVLITWRSAGAMTLIEMLACVVAVIVGAYLSILAFTLPLLASGQHDLDGVNTRLSSQPEIGRVGAQFD